MTRTEGLRWVSRIAAGAMLCALVIFVPPATAEGIAADGPVRGYPRCTVDGSVDGWVWYAGARSLGVTAERSIQVDGTIHETAAQDCRPAVECLVEHPELSGRLATVLGTPHNDHLIGTPGRDLIVGRAGDDDLRGRTGADILCGGPGDDTLRSGRGDDLLAGGGGDDLLFGGPGRDQLTGGPGRDAAYGQAGADRISGGPGADSCFGGGETDTLYDCEVAVETAPRWGGPRVHDFTVVVEEGLAVDRVEVVTEVDRILADDRSWVADGVTGFRRTKGSIDFTIIVASPDTVDRLCAPLGTGGYLSCRNGSKVILNVNRWTGATDWWTAGLDTYREYLVNHEVGHLLGHGHASCPGEGEIAPVMMQQTKSLGACVANGWPYAAVAAG